LISYVKSVYESDEHDLEKNSKLIDDTKSLFDIIGAIVNSLEGTSDDPHV